MDIKCLGCEKQNLISITSCPDMWHVIEQDNVLKKKIIQLLIINAECKIK